LHRIFSNSVILILAVAIAAQPIPSPGPPDLGVGAASCAARANSKSSTSQKLTLDGFLRRWLSFFPFFLLVVESGVWIAIASSFLPLHLRGKPTVQPCHVLVLLVHALVLHWHVHAYVSPAHWRRVSHILVGQRRPSPTSSSHHISRHLGGSWGHATIALAFLSRSDRIGTVGARVRAVAAFLRGILLHLQMLLSRMGRTGSTANCARCTYLSRDRTPSGSPG